MPLVDDHYNPYVNYYKIKLKTYIKRNFDPDSYTSEPIFKTHWVCPQDITFQESPDFLAPFGFVTDGDWDQRPKQCENRIRYEGIKNHFINGAPWNETAYYELGIKKIQQNGSAWWNADDKNVLLDRLKTIDNIYNSIKNQGYKTQKQLYKDNPSAVIESNNDLSTPFLNEIGVNISRDGEYIFRKAGLHRLCVAKCLDIYSVPVLIRRRHKIYEIK